MRLEASRQGSYIQQGVSKAPFLSKPHLAGQGGQWKSNSRLLILKCDRPMVCLTMLGVTVLIFHRRSFLCSQGSFSTGERQGQEGPSEGTKKMAVHPSFPGQTDHYKCSRSGFREAHFMERGCAGVRSKGKVGRGKKPIRGGVLSQGL